MGCAQARLKTKVDVRDLESIVRTGDLILFSSKHAAAQVTKCFTASTWDHCGMVVKFSSRHVFILEYAGGVFLYPRDTKDPSKPGRLRLLYEANPIGMIMEQAGGRASTGREPMLSVKPTGLHQRIGLVFGSKNEVDRIERYHSEPAPREIDNPLFAERTLFRA
jgi:hypothetical protein